VDFRLRPIEPTDGPDIDALLRTEAATTATQMTTHYRHDVYASFVAQHPGLFGVVATTPGMRGLVGMATAYIDDLQIEGKMYPSAHLENLKVRADARRLGLGRQLAEWRIAEARRRFGDGGVIVAGVEQSNAASLATARKWANQVLGPLRIVVGRTIAEPPSIGGVRIRDIQDDDFDAVVEGTNAFHADANLFPRQTRERLQALLAPMDPGGRVRQYRVAVAPDGSIVAGALVTQRFRLMTDRIERLPTPLALLAKVVPILPPDGVIRTAEVSLAWHAPDRLEDGRRLWEAIRHELHGHATHVGAVIDPKSATAAMCRVGWSLGPRLRLMVPVRSPVHLSESRALCLWR
jgi:ribosomal protein S18 acetylase RimI-like enzyme